ncbi:MAG: TonB-dependent receptor [Gammaproteobacteria bacterium]|jgi:outer membrane receptor protein involved in Fe transport|nr:TonB-dependent receptor [Gammaproteobacteria bacterium]
MPRTSYPAFALTLPAAIACLSLSLEVNAQAGRLEEIIVTAEKRETSLQDTSIAVSAFTGMELDRALITKNLDLQFHVPNMLMSKGQFTTASITLRGIGNLAVGSAADSGTGSHFNGVYLQNARIFEIEYYDAERVEILRGPQGTLYGRNTTAGVVNFITKKPEDTFGGDFTVELGDYDHRRVKGAINLPITDNLAQRFALFYTERDGYVDNLFTGDDVDNRDMYSLRSSTLWSTDSFDANLTINYFNEDSTRMRASNQRCKRDPDGIIGCLPTSLADEKTHSGSTASAFLLNQLVAPVLGVTFPADDFINSPTSTDPREQYLDYTPQYMVDDLMVSLEMNWDIGDLQLTSLTGYHWSELDARNDYDMIVASEVWPVGVTLQRAPGSPITTDRSFNFDRAYTTPEQWSQEFRLASDYTGDWNFMVGAFYLTYESETGYQIYSSALELAGQTLGVDEEFHLFSNETDPYELETYAAFGELYWQARDDLMLTFGLRYTEEEKKSRQRTIYLSFLSDGNAPGGGFDSFDGSWDEPTGKFNISWDATEDIMAYMTLSRSYKSGGFNPITEDSVLLDPDQGGDPGLAFFDPEYINAIEFGLKSRLLDNKLQANVTYFYYDYEGLQVSKIIQQTSVNENFDADIQGFEGEFIWVPDENWRFAANVAWLDTEMGEGESVDPANINLLGTTENIVSGPFANIYTGPGCPNNAPTCPGLATSLEGNELPNAPEFSINLTAAYTWWLDNGMGLTAAATYYWQDEFYTRVFNAPNDQVDSWDVINATLTLNSEDRSWYTELWVRNLNNDDYVTGQALADQNVGLATNQFLLEPRTIGATFGYNFGN